MSRAKAQPTTDRHPPPLDYKPAPTTTQPNRAALLKVLADMPNEAFSWLALMIAGGRGRGQVWPDGLGGFTQRSRETIASATTEAERYVGPMFTTSLPAKRPVRRKRLGPITVTARRAM